MPRVAGRNSHGLDRNTELKQRLQLWEAGEIHDLVGRFLGQQHSQLPSRRKRTGQPVTDSEEKACAIKGLVGGAAVGSAECRKHWTTALIPRRSGPGTHPSGVEGAPAARAAWSGGRCKTARGAMKEQGRSKTRMASLPHVKLAPMSAPGPTGERQEHLDAAISFAGAEQRRRLFRFECSISSRSSGHRQPSISLLLPSQHTAYVSEEGKALHYKNV